MALENQMSALSSLKLLNCVSAANTAAATTSFLAVAGYEGQIAIVINTGIITGTITYTFATADNGSGTNPTTIVPIGGALTVVTTSNDDTTAQIALFDVTKLQGYISVIGTVVTGPALISYTLIGRLKTV